MTSAPTLPCFDRLLDDVGSGFIMGMATTGSWNFFKGWRNAPTGDGFRNGLFFAKERGLESATSFAMYGGLFALTDCVIARIRSGTRDQWAGVLSGAVTGALLSVRGGVKPMLKSAASGALMLGAVEVIGHISSRLLAKQRFSEVGALNDTK